MDDAELMKTFAAAHERNEQYLSTVFQRARQRYLSDPEFHALAMGVHRAVEDYRNRAEAPLAADAVTLLTVMVADDLRESLKEMRGEEGPFQIAGTSTVYMDGSSLWHVRRVGKPGIVASLRLFPDDVSKIEALLLGVTPVR